MTSAFVIAGPATGVGKTTVTLGLIQAFRKRGLSVQPYKIGPVGRFLEARGAAGLAV